MDKSCYIPIPTPITVAVSHLNHHQNNNLSNPFIIEARDHHHHRGRKHAVTKSPNFLSATFAGHTLFGGSAEIISNGIRSNRTCTIQISNHLTFPLTDPQFYCYDGGLYYPLPKVIQPGTREACVFSKDPSLPHGVIGLLTYRIGTSEKRIAVMFSVAYNQLQYKNQFGMGLLTRKDLQHPNSDCLPIPTVLNEDGIIINKLELDGEDEIAELFDKMYSDEEFYDQGEGRNHSLANNGGANVLQ